MSWKNKITKFLKKTRNPNKRPLLVEPKIVERPALILKTHGICGAFVERVERAIQMSGEVWFKRTTQACAQVQEKYIISFPCTRAHVYVVSSG